MLCECGCGNEAKKRFIFGHYRPAHRPHPGYRVEENGCWTWLGHITRYGYTGTVSAGTGGGRVMKAYQFYFERERGPVPAGLELDHTCQNPGCVNPWHLEPVTHAENTRRRRTTRLTASDVAEMRGDFVNGFSLGRVAIKFGISRSHASEIKQGRKWKV